MNGTKLLVKDPINIVVTKTTNKTPLRIIKYTILLTLTNIAQKSNNTTNRYFDSNNINPITSTKTS